VTGVALNLGSGLFIDKISPLWVISSSSILCALSPLLMAVIRPSETYWANAFVAQIFQPVCADAMFTVGLLVITEVFPDDTQALAGAVFNTSSQFGNAFGLAIVQVVSTLVTKNRENAGDPDALMEGYRASFWTMFGLMILCSVWGILGMRKTGRVGLKQD
jgi:MFS family permease